MLALNASLDLATFQRPPGLRAGCSDVLDFNHGYGSQTMRRAFGVLRLSLNEAGSDYN